jgi:hypothetical protein
MIAYGRYDHAERLTAQEAQMHPYFSPVRQAQFDLNHSAVMSDNSASSSNSNAGMA